MSFNALTHGISSTRLVDGDAIKAASPHLMDKVHALQDSCGADIGEPGKPMPKPIGRRVRLGARRTHRADGPPGRDT